MAVADPAPRAPGGNPIAPAVEYTILLSVLSLALGLGMLLSMCHVDAVRVAARLCAAVAAFVTLVLFAFAVATSDTRTPNGTKLFALAGGIVGVAVTVQAVVARYWLPQRFRMWSTGAALSLAAAQLFDGTGTYLSVVDPLGLAPGEFHEQVPLSDFVLRSTGLGFPILKWAIALAAAYALGRNLERPQPSAVGIYLVLLAVSLGPALYSVFQLL